jgi:hypothetical protein
MRYVYWLGMIAVMLAAITQIVGCSFYWSNEEQKVSAPPTDADIQTPLAKALREKSVEAQATNANLNFDPSVEDLASAIASKMKNYPVEYNKPRALSLRESTPVELVIKTNEKQNTAPYFKDLEGKVTAATVLVANDVSAELTGPPDRLKITLRGYKMRTISSPEPIAWIWDVEPLKPGNAHVTLEVTSYIQGGYGKGPEPVPIRVLQDTWLVEAHGIEWAKYQIEQIEPIRAFIFAIVTAVVGVFAWFGIKEWKGKGKEDFTT